ncbi:unnamed protein product [Camellia sinensis]
MFRRFLIMALGFYMLDLYLIQLVYMFDSVDLFFQSLSQPNPFQYIIVLVYMLIYDVSENALLLNLIFVWF